MTFDLGHKHLLKKTMKKIRPTKKVLFKMKNNHQNNLVMSLC